MENPTDTNAETVADQAADRFGKARDYVSEKASAAADTVKEKYAAASDTVKEKYAAASDTVKEKYAAASDAVKEKYTAAKEKIGETDFEGAAEQVRSYVRSNPGKALLISVGVGFVIGLLLRRDSDD